MHEPTAIWSLGIAATLGVAASLALAQSASPPDPARASQSLFPNAAPSVAELRAGGQAGLDRLYARIYEGNAALGPDGDALFDAVAGQRYARFARLFWYTELDLAEAEARRTHRPILALRMLGDLREDLSCANSRLFRATLYANTEVATFLRDHFVLYWSSERAVPRVTIDFGDGRKLVRTTTGNSVHYVLDEGGHVLDALPGLYAPKVFRAELTKSLALADQVRDLPGEDRARAIAAYQRAAIAATDRQWQTLEGTPYLAHRDVLTTSAALARAQAATVSKMRIEAPDLEAIGLMRPGELPAHQAEAWAAIGQRIWSIGDVKLLPRHTLQGPALGTDARDRADWNAIPAPMVLDASSQRLIVQLHGALPGAGLDRMVARLEQHIVADTALNEFVLRRAIRTRIASSASSELAALNAWIYDHVFATPRSDPWLGLMPRTDFTGLPGDGAVEP